MSSPDALEHAAGLLRGLVRRNEPLGRRTTYRVGGAAALYAAPRDEHELAVVAEAVSESGIDVLVLGNGSNLLVADAGFRGLVVAIGESFSSVRIDEEAGLVIAGGGCAYPVLARTLAAAGFSGMEWAVGIPGSVGGAVRMNAGGHGAETKDRLESAEVLCLLSATISSRTVEQLDFSYRHSAIGEGEVVLSGSFRIERAEPSASLETIAEIVAWRREHQPGGRNAGSVFSNPSGDAAGRLIEAAGLKGHRIGSAEVSQKHANFFQVDKGGSADDVFALVVEVRRLVAQRLGVELSTELCCIGDFGTPRP